VPLCCSAFLPLPSLNTPHVQKSFWAIHIYSYLDAGTLGLTPSGKPANGEAQFSLVDKHKSMVGLETNFSN
jgi:hypothetical protein